MNWQILTNYLPPDCSILYIKMSYLIKNSLYCITMGSHSWFSQWCEKFQSSIYQYFRATCVTRKTLQKYLSDENAKKNYWWRRITSESHRFKYTTPLIKEFRWVKSHCIIDFCNNTVHMLNNTDIWYFTCVPPVNHLEKWIINDFED